MVNQTDILIVLNRQLTHTKKKKTRKRFEVSKTSENYSTLSLGRWL